MRSYLSSYNRESNFLTLSSERGRIMDLPLNVRLDLGGREIGFDKRSAIEEDDKITKVLGMEITFTTSTEKDEEALALLREFGLPFKK